MLGNLMGWKSVDCKWVELEVEKKQKQDFVMEKRKQSLLTL